MGEAEAIYRRLMAMAEQLKREDEARARADAAAFLARVMVAQAGGRGGKA